MQGQGKRVRNNLFRQPNRKRQPINNAPISDVVFPQMMEDLMVVGGHIEYSRQVGVPEGVDVPAVFVVALVDCAHCDVLDQFGEDGGAVLVGLQGQWGGEEVGEDGLWRVK